jgi:hypothetical protein
MCSQDQNLLDIGGAAGAGDKAQVRILPRSSSLLQLGEGLLQIRYKLTGGGDDDVYRRDHRRAATATCCGNQNRTGLSNQRFGGADRSLRCFFRSAIARPSDIPVLLPRLPHAAQFRRILHEDFSRWQRSQHVRDCRGASVVVRANHALGVVASAFLLKSLQQVGDGSKNPRRLRFRRMPMRRRAERRLNASQNALATGIFSLCHRTPSSGSGTISRPLAAQRGLSSRDALDQARSRLGQERWSSGAQVSSVPRIT